MIDKYFKEYEVRSEFSKEFITLWNGWLGREEIHKLDHVTKEEWERFNSLLRDINDHYQLFKVNREYTKYEPITEVESIIDSYDYSMSKDSCHFTTLIIEELDLVLEESWDYTWIIWHRNIENIQLLEPLIKKNKLYNFNDE